MTFSVWAPNLAAMFGLSFLKRHRYLLLGLLFLSVLLPVGFLAYAELVVQQAGRGQVEIDPARVEPTAVALVLGTSKYLASGRINGFYQNRINAAVSLYQAGKVEHFLLSGDHSRPEYNEPGLMKKDLIAKGIPADRIHLDFAGLRTLDSMIRAKEIFGLEEVLVVSQKFHLERAIYLGEGHGLTVRGLIAADPGGYGARRVRAREILARGLAVLDLRILGSQPRHLDPNEFLPILTTAAE